MAKSGFEHKITFQRQKNTSTVANNTKNRIRKIIWFNPPFSLNVSTHINKKFFSLLGKHFAKTRQLHKLVNRNNVNVNYSSLPNFKSVINGHNKNILNEQEKFLIYILYMYDIYYIYILYIYIYYIYKVYKPIFIYKVLFYLSIYLYIYIYIYIYISIIYINIYNMYIYTYIQYIFIYNTINMN